MCGAFTRSLRRVHRIGAKRDRNRQVRRAKAQHDQATFRPQAGPAETGVADRDASKADEVVKAGQAPTGPSDSPAPPSETIRRRTLALDRDTRPRLLERQSGNGAGRQLARNCGSCCLRSRGQVHGDRSFERFRPESQRAERRRAGQVVPDPMPSRQFPVERILPVGIDDRRTGSAVGVRKVEPRSGQPFMERPDAPRVGAPPGSGLDQSGHGVGTSRVEQPPEESRIEPFVPNREGEAAVSTRLRSVSRRAVSLSRFSGTLCRSPVAHRFRGSGMRRR